MKNAKLVSVIIPAYNCENTIKDACLSILNQSYNNIEIIIINDGSTDNTPKKINELQEVYNNIKLINQSNHGVSYSRNRGIEESKGEYIMFLDSDDTYDNKAVEVLVNNLENNCVELSGIGLRRVYSSGKIEKRHVQRNTNISKNELCKKFEKYYYLDILTGTWGKLYVKKIINKNKIRFNEKISNYEDYLFVMSYISHVKKIYFDERCYYNYNIQDDESLSTKYKPNMENCILYELIPCLETLYKKNGICEDFKTKQFIYFIYLIFINNMKSNNSRKNKYSTMIDICNNKELKKYIKYIKLNKESIKNNIFVFLIKFKLYRELYVLLNNRLSK